MRLTAQTPPITFSDVICHIEFLRRAKQVRKVVLYVRVSGHGQARNANHANHEQRLREWCKRHQVPIVAVFKETRSAKKCDLRELRKAIAKAKNIGAILLSDTPDRFRRNANWSWKNDVPPSSKELQELNASFAGVTVATLDNPDEPYKKNHGEHTKAGQKAKGNKGGRPPKTEPGSKKAEGLRKFPTVDRLHSAGVSAKEIAFETGLNIRRVYRRIQKNRSALAEIKIKNEARVREHASRDAVPVTELTCREYDISLPSYDDRNDDFILKQGGFKSEAQSRQSKTFPLG